MDGEVTGTDLGLGDTSLDEALGADFPEDQATGTVSVAGDNSASPPPETGTQEAQVDAAQQLPPGWNPNGPGDIQKALDQSRANERRYRDELAAFKAQQAQQAQSIDPLDPEAFNHLQSQIVQMEARHQEQRVMDRVLQSDAMARTQYPDFEEAMTTLGRLAQSGLVNLEVFKQYENPSVEAYKFAKQFTNQDPQLYENRVEAEVQRRLSALAPKLQPSKPTGPKTIRNLPAAAVNQDKAPDPLAVSTATVAKMSPEERDNWYESALVGG